MTQRLEIVVYFAPQWRAEANVMHGFARLEGIVCRMEESVGKVRVFADGGPCRVAAVVNGDETKPLLGFHQLYKHLEQLGLFDHSVRP